MSQSLVQIYLHIVFSTKGRKPFLKDRTVREKMHAYLAGTCRGQNSPSIIVGGVEDHVHISCRLGKQTNVSTLIQELKRESSKWIKTESAECRSFSWQGGYGAFSISPAHVDPLSEYIQNQESHHKQVSFKDEFRELCMKYGVDFDERYVWD